MNEEVFPTEGRAACAAHLYLSYEHFPTTKSRGVDGAQQECQPLTPSNALYNVRNVGMLHARHAYTRAAKMFFSDEAVAFEMCIFHMQYPVTNSFLEMKPS